MLFMRTPAGKECSYFYGDYYRGREFEECRLIDGGNGPRHWTPDLCNTCPVPGIQAANACPHLVLHPQIVKKFVLFGRRVNISAYCTKSNSDVAEPKVGCGQCHPLPSVFSLPDEEP
jgi:hypothetical protein